MNAGIPSLHAEEGRDNVQLNPEHYGNHLNVEEGKDQVQLNPERHDDHLQGGEGEDQVQLQKSMWITCKQKKVIIKSNTIQNTMVITCI